MAPQADMILIQHRDCGNQDILINRPPALEARLITHEIGHFLGLLHSEEATLMHPQALTLGDLSFSDQEVYELKKHPSLNSGP